MMKHEGRMDLDRSPQDKAYDLLGELFVERQTERLLRELEEETARGDTAKMDAFFAKQDQLNLARIHAYRRKQKVERLFQHTLPRLARIAAILVAVIALTGGVAIATSHAVRVHVMRLLINIEEQYTAIRLIEDEDASFSVPAGWKGDNYVSYLPADLKLVNVSAAKGNNLAEYADADAGMMTLRFQELSSFAESNVDTEQAELVEVMVHDQVGYLSIKGATVNLFWTDGYHYFVLTTNGVGEAETLTVAEGVRKIN